MRVASKVGNHPSKFGPARRLRSGIIRYARLGQSDRQTDGRTKATLIAPFSMVGGIKMVLLRKFILHTDKWCYM